MARHMAVYTDRQTNLPAQAWHGFKLIMKTAFAFGIGYAYLIIGFSL